MHTNPALSALSAALFESGLTASQRATLLACIRLLSSTAYALDDPRVSPSLNPQDVDWGQTTEPTCIEFDWL